MIYLSHNGQLRIQNCQTTGRKPRCTSDKLTKCPLLFGSELSHYLKQLNSCEKTNSKFFFNDNVNYMK